MRQWGITIGRTEFNGYLSANRVLKEGKTLLCQDDDLLYKIAFRTAQAFEDFKYTYYGYLEEVARAGS